MHNHDNKGMMWMMVICCVMPFVFIFFVSGTGGRESGVPSWVIFGGIALMVVAHFFMMRKSHQHSDDDHEMTSEEDKNKDDQDKKHNSNHDSCH